MAEKREFKGVWIPKHIWLNKNLTITEKLILVEIESYDNDFGCVATNKKICEDIQIKPSTASGIIKGLESKGYLSIHYKNEQTFEGRTIRLKSIPLVESVPPLVKSGGASEESEPSNLFSNTYSDLNINTESSKEDPVGDFKSKNTVNAYKQIVEFWLKEFHIGFTFNSTSGNKVKSIITKFKTLLKNESRPITDDAIVNAFKYMCVNLPDFYKDKDLAMLDSKFNEIILDIKNKNNGVSTNTKPQSRFRTT